jgi:pimeloyl-ACP methyl ester carboxylesterase
MSWRKIVWGCLAIAPLMLVAITTTAWAAGACPRALAGHWEGSAKAGEESLKVALDVDPLRAPCVASADFPDLPLYGVAYEVELKDGAIQLARKPKGAAPSQFGLKATANALSGTFAGLGVRQSTVDLKRTDPHPHLFREEALKFADGDVTLSGTLILPTGPGPYPAMVVVHGSGPESRDTASYRSRGLLFARHGVAALIYDKRGTGTSTGDFTTAGMDDLARDALAGVDALMARSDMRRDRVGIAGHSQGGWIAPLSATLSGRVAFIFVSSAAGIGPMAQSVFDNSNQMRAAGYAEDVVQRAQELRGRLYDGVRAGKFPAQLQRDLEGAQKEPWFASSQLPSSFPLTVSDGERRLLLFEPLPVWRRVQVHVLALWGGEDTQVPAEKSRDLIVAALHEGGNAAVEAHVLPGLNHLLLRARAKNAPAGFARGSPDYEALLSSWIAGTVVGHQG